MVLVVVVAAHLALVSTEAVHLAAEAGITEALLVPAGAAMAVAVLNALTRMGLVTKDTMALLLLTIDIPQVQAVVTTTADRDRLDTTPTQALHPGTIPAVTTAHPCTLIA